MPRTSNDNGRAFEYAFVTQLADYLINHGLNVNIVGNSSFITDAAAYDRVPTALQNILITASDAAISQLNDIEPILFENNEDVIEIQLQSDRAGISGDVRDIVVSRSNISWNIGFSLKHNHFAVKHSRISRNLDFALSWFGINCSDEYWNEVNPIFSMLENIGRERLWSSIENKEEMVYIPLLIAFINEINRCDEIFTSIGESLASKMVEYLLGRYDFYKIISVDRENKTLIQPFNLRGTLNQNSRRVTVSINIPITTLPTRINFIGIKENSKTTVELCCDNGWYFTFRIHNASSRVEPSLKFDIQIAGIPTTIMTLNCLW